MTKLRVALVLGIWIATVAAAALIGHVVQPRFTNATMVSGTAYVGGNVISAKVHGAEDFAIPLDVAWLDVYGAWHEGGRPQCLSESKLGSFVPVRFGYDWVGGPNGVSWPQVVWVSCAVSAGGA